MNASTGVISNAADNLKIGLLLFMQRPRSARGGPFSSDGISVAISPCVKPSIYNYSYAMCTFFVRNAALAVLLAGCGSRAETANTPGQPAPRTDTLRISVPVIRLTTTDSANGSAQLDSATLALLERRIMSRVASLLRAESHIATGNGSAGITPVKNSAPEIRHGLLGTITFDEDGAIDQSSRARISAIAEMLDRIDAPLEIRSQSQLGTRNMDVAIARARRVYVDLITANKSLSERDVAISISGVNSLFPINPTVEIFWRQPN